MIPPVGRTRAWAMPGWSMLAWGMVMMGAGAGFAAITEDVLDCDGLTAADPIVVSLVRDHHRSWLTGLMRVLSDVAAPEVLAFAAALIGAGLAWRRITVAPLLLLGAAGIGSILMGAAVRLLVERPRPPVAWRAIGGDGFSFPSQHTMTAMSVAGMLAYLITASRPARWRPRRQRAAMTTVVWAGALLAATGVGFSRVYLGVHWPSDVACSGMLGAGWLAALIITSISWRAAGAAIGTARARAGRASGE